MLRVKDLIKFAKTQLDIYKFLSEYEYLKESNREWFCNLMSTLIHKKFINLLTKRTKDSNQKLLILKNYHWCKP